MEGVDTKTLQEIREGWYRYPKELFFKRVLGVNLWEKEEEIVLSIRDNKRTAIRSCNASGKTFTIARVALWYLMTFQPSIVVQTAPTYRQVKNQFWREIRKAHKSALIPLGGQMNQTEYNITEDWYAIGLSTKDGEEGMERLQGFHSPNILFIVDEASGVDRYTFEAIEGSLMGENARLVLIGNPTRNTGEFAQAFKSPLYNKIHISAFDTPNLKAGKTIINGLVTKEWVEEMRIKYGTESDVWRVRVMGDFPKRDSDTIIQVHMVESAIREERELYGKKKVIGLDVARKGGDNSVFVLRKGNYAEILEKIEENDLMELAGKAVRYLKEHKDAVLHVDVIGLGAGVYDRLIEIPEVSDRVFGVNMAKEPVDKESYVNLRTESWYNIRDWIRDAKLSDHEDWYELAVPRYKINSRGKLQMESKDDMRKRGVKSPDVGDALALTLVEPNEGAVIAPMWI